MGAYWDAVDTLAPLAYWKLGEAYPAATAVDASGNGRDGAYTGLEEADYGNPSIINSELGTCIDLLNGGENMQVAHDAGWMEQAQFSAVFTGLFFFTNNTLRKPVGRRNDRWYFSYAGDTREIQFILDTDTGAVVLSSGGGAYPDNVTPVHVVMTYDGADMVLYANGSSWTAPHTGTPTAIGALFVGPAGQCQGFQFYDYALSAANVATLEAAWAEEGQQPPSDPPGWVTDPGGETFDASAPMEWQASVDPEGDPIEYRGFLTDDGDTWAEMFTWQAGRTYDLDTSALVFGSAYQVRIQARDSANGLESAGYLTSDAFTVAHPATDPAAPTLMVLELKDNSALISLSGFDGAAGRSWLDTRYQLIAPDYGDTFDAPRWNSDWVRIANVLQWLTRLDYATRFEIRASVRDDGGNVGEWSTPVEILTTRHRIVGTTARRPRNLGSDATTDWRYVHFTPGWSITLVNAGVGDVEPGVLLGPELGDIGLTRGARLNMHRTKDTGNGGALGGFSVEEVLRVDADGVPQESGASHFLRIPGAAAHIDAAPWSMFIAVAPFPLSIVSLMEWVGIPTAQWIDSDGATLKLTYGPTHMGSVTDGAQEVVLGNNVVDEALNTAILVSAADPNNVFVDDGGGCIMLDAGSTPAEIYAAVNGVWGQLDLGLSGQVLTGGCPPTQAHRGIGNPSAKDWIDLGKGSSIVTGGGGPTIGYIGAFCVWPVALTEAEYTTLHARAMGTDPEAFWEYVTTGIVREDVAVTPLIATPLDEPLPPAKPTVAA